jgi:hypothetical protein
MDLKKLLPIGLILLLIVVAAICIFGGLGTIGRGLGGLLGGGDDNLANTGAGELGQMYTALEVDQDGCPVETAGEFYSDESIYAGVDESTIPAGTSIFMRLYHEGQPVEDTDVLEADQDLRTCLWFEFTPTGAAGFEPGNYEAELFVNGNSADAITFEVLDEGAAGELPAQSGLEGIDFGRVTTTSQVDQDGCPLDQVSEYRSDEPVYVAIDESFIPKGTEIFVRLYQEGEIVEDTEPIVAEGDLETCAWFEFQGNSLSGGLEPGFYEADVVVNGEIADTVEFEVQ